jgi:hypothetical protein
LQPVAANALSRRDSGSKLHKKSASGSYEKLPRSPQILRQRWIIFGEFVVSFTSTHFFTLPAESGRPLQRMSESPRAH